MYATFTSDLESMTLEEATKNRDFEKTIAAMQQEVIDMTADKEKKEGKKATAEANLADTTAQMKADTAFFDATKEKCEEKSAEWSTRKELRAEELAGIEKALEILTSDAARDLFRTAIKPGIETFLQMFSTKDAANPAIKAYAA